MLKNRTALLFEWIWRLSSPRKSFINTNQFLRMGRSPQKHTVPIRPRAAKEEHIDLLLGDIIYSQ